MKFEVYGEKNHPVIVMLTGSFCPGECLEYIATQLCDEYFIVIPTYNGHHENSKDFTTRKGEAKEIAEYLAKTGIDCIKMIYGQSMGTEIGMELFRQLKESGTNVENLFFDGAPMIRLSKAYKVFMYFKFKSMLRLFKEKTVDEAMNMKFLKAFAGDKIASLKPMIMSLVSVAPFLTRQSIKNQVECCYTFDFPPATKEMQKQMYFFFGEDEKAYKTCRKGIKKAYPEANYRVEKGQGHMTFSCENTKVYVDWLKEICKTGTCKAF